MADRSSFRTLLRQVLHLQEPPRRTAFAFALGVFALVRSRLAPGLRIFLLGLAVIDDLGAIVLIAILFTGQLSAAALAGAAICLVALDRKSTRLNSSHT